MTRKSAAAERELRRKQVAANLLAGLNYREMAEALDVSLGTIKGDVDIVLGRWQQEQAGDVADYVTLAERRLDRALNAIWGDVLAGDSKAITAMLKIEERRAKLRGLDQPDKVQHSGSVETRTDPLEGLDADARRKLIDNLIRARRAPAAPRRDASGDGAD
ncbi:MAG TPA: hypothetical protein PKH77_05140 [Anaerolineae bacterium]|nr:hypothetical protein [Anaerolineae bacterium]